MLGRQLPLPLALKRDCNFQTFYAGSNQSIVDTLGHLVRGHGEQQLYLWGDNGSGVSHLLQACCDAMSEHGLTACYLPLQEMPESACLQDWEGVSLLALDDIESVLGNPVWEEALFHCYNRCVSNGTRLILGGHHAAQLLVIKLADLRSRLVALLALRLHSLSDLDKLAVLQHWAKLRGLVLSEEVGYYLLHHFPRDLQVLLALFNQLDQASMAAQRRLTIPFVKSVLAKEKL